jgi:hypothetical protein
MYILKTGDGLAGRFDGEPGEEVARYPILVEFSPLPVCVCAPSTVVFLRTGGRRLETVDFDTPPLLH